MYNFYYKDSITLFTEEEKEVYHFAKFFIDFAHSKAKEKNLKKGLWTQKLQTGISVSYDCSVKGGEVDSVTTVNFFYKYYFALFQKGQNVFYGFAEE